MRESHKAIKELTEIVTELAQIVRDLDPSRVATYARLEDRFVKVRAHLTQAAAYERS